MRIEHVDRVIRDALDQQAKPALGLEQSLLRLALVGHVAGDLRKTDQLPVVGLDRVEHHARPKPAAVLAHTPAFALELAFAPGDLEHLLRQSRRFVFLSVKLGEMLADDFVGLEALDPLGTCVPAGHAAAGIEHVDRIVDDRLDEQPERVLGYRFDHQTPGPLNLARRACTPRPTLNP